MPPPGPWVGVLAERPPPLSLRGWVTFGLCPRKSTARATPRRVKRLSELRETTPDASTHT